jgi:hypothetical protein
MEEQRFIIYESIPGFNIWYRNVMTESELKRRLCFIRDWRGKIEVALNVLLHGEEKEQHAKSLRKAWRDCCDCVHEGEIGTLSCQECFDDPARPNWENKAKQKRLPTDEWETWAHNLADAIYFRADSKLLAERLLTIPCNPRKT